jgi:hypothetical protein
MLAKLLLHSQMKIVKETTLTVSNIAACNAIQITPSRSDPLITNNIIFIFHLLADMLGKGDFKCHKEVELLCHHQHHFG